MSNEKNLNRSQIQSLVIPPQTQTIGPPHFVRRKLLFSFLCRNAFTLRTFPSLVVEGGIIWKTVQKIILFIGNGLHWRPWLPISPSEWFFIRSGFRFGGGRVVDEDGGKGRGGGKRGVVEIEGNVLREGDRGW